MSFMNYTYTSCNGISFFGWNLDRTKLGIVVSNMEEDSLYNGPVFAVELLDSETIRYYDPNDNPYILDSENYDPDYLESLLWSEDRWNSEYVRYFSVK